MRPERAENRLPALPERGPRRAERRMGRPHMPLARGHGREPALAAIACEKSDLVHIPPRLVHVKDKTRPVSPVEARHFLELIRSDRLRATGEDKRPRRLSRTAMRSLLTRPGGWPGSAAFAGEVTAHRSRGHQRVQLENGERRLASSSWRVGRGAGRPPPPSARLGARHGVSQSAASAWRAGKAQEQCTGK